MPEADKDNPTQRHYRNMTVAQIRESPDDDFAKVVFLESARFYRLLRGHSDYERLLKLLRDAMNDRRALKVGLARVDSDIIEDVQIT
jgi:hypothetical protein